MEYLALKWIHILSSTVLFGTGIGSAFYLLATTLSRNPRAVAVVSGWVVWADWLFTTPTAIVQPLTGWMLVRHASFQWSQPWLHASVVLYGVAIACWLPVVRLQYLLRDEAQASASAGTPLSSRYWRLFTAWTSLGFIAFAAFLLIFWLMVTKQWPWAHG